MMLPKLQEFETEKFVKRRKGITLIAMVITIIVLLILAGISISMLSRRQFYLTKSHRC